MNNQINEKISVIIPFYNAENYLRRCVESISAQTYRNLEILLVDDGSEDDSASVARELAAADARVIYFCVPHGGVSRARNAGLAKATGTYVMFADSDDWMRSNIVEHMLRTMQQESADLVTCDLAFAEQQGEEVRSKENVRKEICSGEEFLRLFFRIRSNEWVHYPVAKLYRMELLPQPLYPPDIRVGEDVLGTYLAVADAKKIVRIREVGYYYFRNPQSASGDLSEKTFDLISVWDEMIRVTEGREPDHAYAKLNRDRLNFGLLFRLITEVPRLEIRTRFSEQERQLRADLAGCKKKLLHAPIVFSRKVLIFLMCHMYPFMAFAGNLHVHLRRRRRVEAGVSRRRQK